MVTQCGRSAGRRPVGSNRGLDATYSELGQNFDAGQDLNLRPSGYE